MSRLVRARIEVLAEFARRYADRLRPHRLRDLLHLPGHVLRHLDVVVLPVEGHPQQRLAVRIAIGRIEVEIDVAVRHVGAVRVHRDRVRVVVLDGLLPRRAPLRRTGRRRDAADRLHAGLVHPQRRAADEAERAVVEVVRIEIVHRDAVAARADERVRVGVLVEERLDRRQVLVREIAAHDTFAGDRVVRFADARQQQQVHVVVLERGHDHEIGRLVHFTPCRVDVGHARRALLRIVEVDPQHVALRAQLEVRRLLQRGQDVQVRRRLRVHVARVAAAVAAEVARAHLHAVRVRVRARRVRRRQPVRMQAERLGRVGEALRRIGVELRGQREVVAAVRFEHVAVADHLAADLVRLPRRAEHLFGEVEMRLELLVGHAGVLDRHPFGDELPAVALFIVAAQAQLFRRDPEMHARPVQPRAADAFARQERGELPVRQRSVLQAVADRHGRLRQVEEQLLADVVGQLVDRVRIRAVRIGVAVLAALERDHVQARFGQFLRENRAGPAEADDHRIDMRLFLCGHQLRSPLIETGPYGYDLPFWLTKSMKSARAPGKPIIFHAAMS